jgi:transcriptional regulator GlxA family with amidase domain
MTHRVGLLIFPGFQILDLAGPLAAFEIAGRFVQGAYALSMIAKQEGAVAASGGISVLAQAFDDPDFDTLVVAGGRGTRGAAGCEATLAFIREVASRDRRIASVCSGAFLLAGAGLLAHRRVTTHWRYAAELARLYPKVIVEPDSIFVRDGSIWTSAGISAGIDLALALIGHDHGDGVAARVAKELVVHHRRPGGQSQFSALMELPIASDRVGRSLAFARTRLHERLSVERLAAAAGLSPRQFARVFQAETGTTPAKAIERLRVESARAALEAGRAPMDGIATASGFQDPERMRRAFIRAFGQPPQSLRRAAHATSTNGFART